MTGRSGRRRRRNPWKWLGALSAAVAFHAVWFYTLNYQWRHPEPATASPTPWRVLHKDDASEMTAWYYANEWRSPEGFGLPRAYGFSRLLLQERVPMRPPVDRPPVVDLTWPRPSVAERRAPPAVYSPEVAYWRQPLEWPAVDGLQRRSRPTTAEPPIPRINRVDPASGRLMEQLTWPEERGTWGRVAWTAVLALSVNEYGVVTEALLDQRTDDPDVNALLLQSALRWRWTVSETRDWVRVEIEYAGMAARRHIEEPP